jgi:SAM-dependent methyltransferase
MTDKHCELCGVRLLPRFLTATDPISLERFDVLACPGCGLGATYPKPQDLSPYYGERYYGERHWITTAYCTWRRLRVIRLTLGRDCQPSILDVGCGDGTFLHAARAKGWRVAGTELRGAAGASSGEIRVWSSLAEITMRFDCVTAWHVLEHLPHPLESVLEMKCLLAPDGALLLAVPDCGGWQARLSGRFWFHLDVPRHLFHFDLASLRLLLETAGFQVVQIWHHELEYDLFGWIQSALNALLQVPNVLFDSLTGRTPRGGRLRILWSLFFAILAFPAAFLLTVVSTLVGRGGTLIVAARPRA